MQPCSTAWNLFTYDPLPRKDLTDIGLTTSSVALFEVSENSPRGRNSFDVLIHDHRQLAYKLSMSTFEVVSYMAHSITSFLDGGLHIVRVVFLEFADDCDSLDRSNLLQIVQENGVEPNVLNVLLDYFLRSYSV